MKKVISIAVVIIFVISIGIYFYRSPENSGTIVFHDKVFSKSDLSQETLEWLELYNILSEEEQLAVSYIPPDLYALYGYPDGADIEAVEATEEKWDLIPMVMVNGTLYLDTGKTSTVEGRCGVMDGTITSQVESNENPTVNDQSNFGTGYGYQYGAQEGTIELYLNEKWRIFATEEVRQNIQFP